MPEQTQTHQTGTVLGSQTIFHQLDHQHRHPDQAAQHVQTMGTDQSKEGGEERTAIRSESFANQVGKFVDLHADKAQPEDKGDCQPTQYRLLLLLVKCQHGKAVGHAAEQQQEGLDQNVREFEDLLGRGAIGNIARQNRIGCKQSCKQNAVVHQVDPEAENRIPAGIMMMLGMMFSMGGLSRRMMENFSGHGLPLPWQLQQNVHFRSARPPRRERSNPHRH